MTTEGAPRVLSAGRTKRRRWHGYWPLLAIAAAVLVLWGGLILGAYELWETV
jgi:hypothetical protein